MLLGISKYPGFIIPAAGIAQVTPEPEPDECVPIFHAAYFSGDLGFESFAGGSGASLGAVDRIGTTTFGYKTEAIVGDSDIFVLYSNTVFGETYPGKVQKYSNTGTLLDEAEYQVRGKFAVTEDAVYIAAYDAAYSGTHKLYKLDRSLNEVWAVATGDADLSETLGRVLGATENYVYVLRTIGFDQYLQRYSTADGSEDTADSWPIAIGSSNSNHSYVVSADDYLYGVEFEGVVKYAPDGSEVWRRADLSMYDLALASDGLWVTDGFAAASDDFYKLSLADGSLLDTITGDAGEEPSIWGVDGEGNIYYSGSDPVSSDPSLVSREPDGTLRWRSAASENTVYWAHLEPCTQVTPYVFVAEGAVDKKLYKLDSSGLVDETDAYSDYEPFAVAADGDYVYVTHRTLFVFGDIAVRKFKISDMSEVLSGWPYTTPTSAAYEVQSIWVHSNGDVIFPARKVSSGIELNLVRAASDGSTLWTLPLDDSLYNPWSLTTDDDGNIYIGTQEGDIIKVAADGSGIVASYTAGSSEVESVRYHPDGFIYAYVNGSGRKFDLDLNEVVSGNWPETWVGTFIALDDENIYAASTGEVRKYDLDANLLWSIAIPDNPSIRGIEVAQDGKIYVVSTLEDVWEVTADGSSITNIYSRGDTTLRRIDVSPGRYPHQWP